MQVEGSNGGGKRRGTRRQNQARGAGRRLSSGGWQGVGVGDVQVDGAPYQERRWGAGVNERYEDNDQY